jgi:DNA-binding transcriptional regulator YhcF (GntR family)
MTLHLLGRASAGLVVESGIGGARPFHLEGCIMSAPIPSAADLVDLHACQRLSDEGYAIALSICRGTPLDWPKRRRLGTIITDVGECWRRLEQHGHVTQEEMPAFVLITAVTRTPDGREVGNGQRLDEEPWRSLLRAVPVAADWQRLDAEPSASVDEACLKYQQEWANKVKEHLAAIVARLDARRQASEPLLDTFDVEILKFLLKQGQRLSAQEDIATGADVSRDTVSKSLNHLREAGLTCRPKGDRSGEGLTEDGKKLAERLERQSQS